MQTLHCKYDMDMRVMHYRDQVSPEKMSYTKDNYILYVWHWNLVVLFTDRHGSGTCYFTPLSQPWSCLPLTLLAVGCTLLNLLICDTSQKS